MGVHPTIEGGRQRYVIVFAPSSGRDGIRSASHA